MDRTARVSQGSSSASLFSGALVCSLVFAVVGIGARANAGDRAADAPSEVTRRYYEAWGVASDDATTHLKFARSMRRYSRFEEARKYFEEALALDPDYLLAHIELGELMVQMGAVDLAVAHLEAAVSSDAARSDPVAVAKAHLQLGQIDSGAGRGLAAIAHYEQAVALDASTSARMKLGLALFDERRDDAALEQFEAALRDNPMHPLSAYYLARCRDRRGEAQAAQEMYRRALELAKGVGRQSLIDEIELRLR